MAAGVPVVATSISGIPELVDATTGWLAPPGQPEGLADAIARALDEPQDARLARARRARQRIEAQFDLQQQVKLLGLTLRAG
jgi:glycosyltransferase involved in cell wall biosynthesis